MIAETEITSQTVAGRTLAALALRGCVVVALRRSEHLIAPNGSTELKVGDVPTLLGGEAALEQALAKLNPA